MGKFVTVEKVSLDFLGDEWKDAYLKFSGISFNDSLELADISADEAQAKETAERVLTLLKKHFVAGEGWDGKELVSITADDLGDLPVSVITSSIRAINGGIDPNS